ncbi:sugar ABC transporter substrate-binding protein [Wenjunlia vitaminophila]|uniref:Sugar ABC transporter substrate-binding protein n=2 Tax=Wenjunlia vitaminophila TaxID=76728 RepID=A0A0T6LX92_WENVI|nr:extracellular solute-binding protein [Wenjunlia vitaminophila]KRV48167.1 sugar ABC transporter substrate-binding protein [Wenjunlia vitaminophila]KRV50625.1 sugar ABC transporter substrate-binding protein [Wenjunlia vitaminophila]
MSRLSSRRPRLRVVAAPLLASALAGAALTGCGDSGGSDNTVTMWTYPVIFDEAKNKAYWDGLVKEFEKKHSDIKVKVETFPWANRDTALATAIASGKGPDVVYLIPDQMPKYANNIIPADEYMPADAKSDYLDFALNSVTVDGKALGTPVLTSANALICDKRVFDAIGESSYPETWEDLSALAPKLKDKGYYATSYGGDTQQTLNLTFYPLLWQAGGDVFTEDGSKVAFNDAAGVKALTWLKQLVDGGYTDKDLVSTTPKLEQTPVAKGKVACTWQNTPADVEPFWGKENIVVRPPLKDTESVGYGTVGALSMLKGADKDAAGEWINFVAEPGNAAGLEKQSGLFPARKSAKDLYPDDAVQQAVAATLPSMVAGPMQDKAREVMGLLAPEIQAALIGKKSPQEALDAAAKAADALLAR